MDINKLVKQLKREAKANPGRSGVLGVVTLVAIYFWAPLVMGWFSDGASKPAATPATEPAAPAAQVAVVEGSGAVGNGAGASMVPTIAWETLVKAVESDPRLASAELPSSARDPFEPPPVPEATDGPIAAVEKAAAADAPTKLDFATLGLQLESTIVGDRGSVAMINGKTYRLNEDAATPVFLEQHGQQFEFQLVEVGRKTAVLEYQGQPFTISIPTAAVTTATIERN